MPVAAPFCRDDELPAPLADIYNTKRLHSSLGYLPPMEFEAAYAASRQEGDEQKYPVSGVQFKPTYYIGQMPGPNGGDVTF